MSPVDASFPRPISSDSWLKEFNCLFATSGASGVILVSSTEARGDPRKNQKPDHSRLGGGSFNNQGNLHMRLILGSYEVGGFWPPSFSFSFLFFFFFFFFFFRAAPAAYGSSRTRGQSCSCRPMPQAQQLKIWAVSVTYTTAHSNADP